MGRFKTLIPALILVSSLLVLASGQYSDSNTDLFKKYSSGTVHVGYGDSDPFGRSNNDFGTSDFERRREEMEREHNRRVNEMNSEFESNSSTIKTTFWTFTAIIGFVFGGLIIIGLIVLACFINAASKRRRGQGGQVYQPAAAHNPATGQPLYPVQAGAYTKQPAAPYAPAGAQPAPYGPPPAQPAPYAPAGYPYNPSLQQPPPPIGFSASQQQPYNPQFPGNGPPYA